MWWAWVGHAIHAASFDTDDLVHRLATAAMTLAGTFIVFLALVLVDEYTWTYGTASYRTGDGRTRPRKRPKTEPPAGRRAPAYTISYLV